MHIESCAWVHNLKGYACLLARQLKVSDHIFFLLKLDCGKEWDLDVILKMGCLPPFKGGCSPEMWRLFCSCSVTLCVCSLRLRASLG
jgi:hypothetical protein